MQKLKTIAPKFGEEICNKACSLRGYPWRSWRTTLSALPATLGHNQLHILPPSHLRRVLHRKKYTPKTGFANCDLLCFRKLHDQRIYLIALWNIKVSTTRFIVYGIDTLDVVFGEKRTRQCVLRNAFDLGYAQPSRKTDAEFEFQMRSLGLTRDTCLASWELRRWCEANRNRLYVPEWLLECWGIPVDPDYSGFFVAVRRLIALCFLATSLTR